MYSNISQILLLYNKWWYYNKFDGPKSLGVCYWCVKIPHCGYMEHGLKHISFYVQKHIVAMGMCCNPALVDDKTLGAPASKKLVYWVTFLQNPPKRHPVTHPWGQDIECLLCIKLWSVFCSVIVILYVISCYIGPLYNDTKMYWTYCLHKSAQQRRQ